MATIFVDTDRKGDRDRHRAHWQGRSHQGASWGERRNSASAAATDFLRKANVRRRWHIFSLFTQFHVRWFLVGTTTRRPKTTRSRAAPSYIWYSRSAADSKTNFAWTPVISYCLLSTIIYTFIWLSIKTNKNGSFIVKSSFVTRIGIGDFSLISATGRKFRVLRDLLEGQGGATATAMSAAFRWREAHTYKLLNIS